MTPDEWRTAIGAKVEAARAGRSVRSMSKRAGISEGLWRQIESGQRPIRHGEYETVSPKRSTVIAVCDALSLPRDTFERWARGETVEASAPYPSMNDADVIDLINHRLGEWFMESGPPGIPDHFLNDDDWLADVRERDVMLFGLLMMERDRRELAKRVDELSTGSASAPTGLNETQATLTEKVLSSVEDLVDRLVAVEAEVRRLRSRRGSDESS